MRLCLLAAALAGKIIENGLNLFETKKKLLQNGTLHLDKTNHQVSGWEVRI